MSTVPVALTLGLPQFFVFDGQQRLGLRWNGSEDGTVQSVPTSRGHATWFVVPVELETVLKAAIVGLRDIECPR